MTYTTNTTFVNTSNNFYDALVGVNNASNNFLTTALIIGIWIFVYSRTVNRGTTSAFIASSFATSIIATMLWFIDLTSWLVVTFSVLLLLASVIKRAFE